MTMTTEEAAEIVGVQPVTIRQWVRKGWLKPLPRLDPTRRHHLFLLEDVIRCRAAHRSAAEKARLERAQGVWRALLQSLDI